MNMIELKQNETNLITGGKLSDILYFSAGSFIGAATVAFLVANPATGMAVITFAAEYLTSHYSHKKFF